jgi:Holliday junction resolvase RusA-like endonuclease
MIEFVAAYPPSVNHTKYRSGKLRPGISSYRSTVGWLYKAAGGTRFEGPVSIEIELYKPALKVPYDVDNAPHNVLNALKGVAYEDDDQVHLLVVAKMWPDGRGRAVVRVKKIRAATGPA